jgi:hypothetical protein
VQLNIYISAFKKEYKVKMQIKFFNHMIVTWTCVSASQNMNYFNT